VEDALTAQEEAELAEMLERPPIWERADGQ